MKKIIPIPEDLNKNYKPILLEFLQIGIKFVALKRRPFILFPHYFIDHSAVK
jgi:hypothetical protein